MAKETLIRFRVDDAEKERIRAAAAAKGVDMSKYVLALVMRDVKRVEKTCQN